MINMSSYHGVDRWTRNARLYKSLCDIGLVVVPVYTADNTGRIDALYVTAGLPTEIGLTEDPVLSWQSRYAQSQHNRPYAGQPSTAPLNKPTKQSDTVVPFRRR